MEASAPGAENRHRRRGTLLERTSQVVDSIVWMVRIDDLEDHIVASLQLAHNGVELLLGGSGLLVDGADLLMNTMK